MLAREMSVHEGDRVRVRVDEQVGALGWHDDVHRAREGLEDGEPDGPASQEEPSTSSFAVVRQQLQLCMAVFRALGTVIEQHPDNFVLTLLQRIDVLQRLGSAIGVVWLYARNVADDKVGQGQGRTTPGTIDTSVVMRILSQLLLQVVRRALGSLAATLGGTCGA